MAKKSNKITNKEKETTLEKDLKATENADETDVKSDNTVENKEDSTEINIDNTEESSVDTNSDEVENKENIDDTVEDNNANTEVDSADVVNEETVETEDKPVETEDVKEVDTKRDKFTAHDLVWIAIGLVIGILLSYCIFNMTLSSAIQKLASETQTTTSVVDKTQQNDDGITGISTYDDPNVVISDKAEIENAQEIMLNYINGITKGSTYSQVMTGEEQYVYYMYNSKGEIFTQDMNSTYTEVFLNDNRVFKYDTDKQVLSVGSDIDIVSIFRNAVEAIGNDNVTLYEMDLSEVEAPEGHEYRIDFVGEDAVKMLYKSVGDEFATDMVESIKSSINDWEPHIIMVMFIGDNVEDSYSYCLYVIDNSEYTNWFFQGYDTIDDWTLEEDWYAYDAESDENGEKYSALMNTLVENVNTVMLNYADSKGWLADEEPTSETVEESTEENTETAESTEEAEESTENNN